MYRERNRREWILLAVILLLGIGLMCAAGQMAIRPSRGWQVPADMRSNIDPDGRYQYAQETLVIEPLDQDILTPVTWPEIYVTSTRPGDLPAPTAAPSATRTITRTPPPTSTATATPVPSATASLTASSTKTATPLPATPTNTLPPDVGRIVIIQNSILDGPQNFAFGSTMGAFTLDDDTDGTFPNTRDFSSVLVGTRLVAQGAVSGWTLTGLTCSDPDGGTSVNLITRTATIDLDNGETVICTFTDHDDSLGTVTVIEDSILDDPQDFGFSTSFAGVFSLDDDGNPSPLSSSRLMIDVPVGSHTVTETVPGGWNLTGLTCVDPDGGSSGSVVTRIATIDMDAAEDITCTFTNTDTDLGSITIVENSLPNDAQDFAFSGSIPALNFSLDDDADGTLPNSRTVTLLPPSTYGVQESAPAGWDLTGLSCADPTGNSLWSVATGAASIVIDPGENVTCTYTNSRRGTITIVENSILDDPQDFTYSASFLGLFTLDDDPEPTFDNSRTFGNIPVGDYAVTETVPANWSLLGLTCADPTGNSSTAGSTADITLDPAETVTCTFTNRDDSLGTIVIVETSIYDDPQDFSYSSGTLGAFTLDDDGVGSNAATFVDLPMGTHTVQQDDPAGWTLTGLSCDDGSPVNPGTRTASIDLGYAETVTCTFTNTDDSLGRITIVEDSVPNGQSFGFTGTSPLGSFSLADSSTTFDLLPMGTYTVQETLQAGWDLVLSCSDGSVVDPGTGTATIDLGYAEDVTCTFTNTQRGRIRIIENSLPDDPQDFTFTPSWTSPFILDDDGVGSNVATFADLPAGIYTVTENDPTSFGWSLSILTCSDPTGGTTSSVATRTATIDLAAGDNVDCTFTNNYNFPQIDIGGPNGVWAEIPVGYSWSSGLPTPITPDGGAGWDFVLFEHSAGSGILMDYIRIEISVDGLSWIPVFYYGGGQYANSSIAGCPQVDNTDVPFDCGPPVSLISMGGYTTGIGIDIDALGLTDTYGYILIISPPGADAACDVDSIYVYP